MKSAPAPLPRSVPTKSGILVYAVLLTAVLYSMIFHLSPDSPLRRGGTRPPPLEKAESFQMKNVTQINQASEQKNVQLHFQMPNTMWDGNASYFTGVYFRAAYEMFPRRVFAGSDDRVINFPADLRAADRLPDVTWLRQHQVANVFTFIPGDETGPKAVVYPVP